MVENFQNGVEEHDSKYARIVVLKRSVRLDNSMCRLDCNMRFHCMCGIIVAPYDVGKFATYD